MSLLVAMELAQHRSPRLDATTEAFDAYLKSLGAYAAAGNDPHSRRRLAAVGDLLWHLVQLAASTEVSLVDAVNAWGQEYGFRGGTGEILRQLDAEAQPRRSLQYQLTEGAGAIAWCIRTPHLSDLPAALRGSLRLLNALARADDARLEDCVAAANYRPHATDKPNSQPP